MDTEKELDYLIAYLDKLTILANMPLPHELETDTFGKIKQVTDQINKRLEL